MIYIPSCDWLKHCRVSQTVLFFDVHDILCGVGQHTELLHNILCVCARARACIRVCGRSLNYTHKTMA